MNKLLTLTIGIPAYNEEQNITSLLRSLVNQATDGFELTNIIVISDGSTDRTVYNAQKVSDSRIKIVSGNTRLGKAARLNKIFQISNSDLLITLDADVMPGNSDFLSKFVNKFIKDQNVQLACARVLPNLNSTSLIAQIIAHSQSIKVSLFEEIRDISPIYLFVGRAFGYRKNLYKKLKYPEGLIAEDAYACLYSLKNNLKVWYEKDATVLYTLPSTLSDHLRQSARFYNSWSQLKIYFREDFIKSSFKISKSMLLKSFLRGFIKSPLYTTLYMTILLYSKMIISLNWVKPSYLWEVSSTSKKVIQGV